MTADSCGGCLSEALSQCGGAQRTFYIVLLTLHASCDTDRGHCTCEDFCTSLSFINTAKPPKMRGLNATFRAFRSRLRVTLTALSD